MDKYELAIFKKRLNQESSYLLGYEDFLKTGICILLLWQEDEYHFVFQKRTMHISQGGEICFPGGKKDPTDVDFLDTVLRETEEEMGILQSKLEVIGPLGTLVTPAGIFVESFIVVAKVSSLEEMNINSEEVEFAFTIPVSYFVQNEPLVYNINIEMQPFEIDDQGKAKVLFPAKDFLGIPRSYTQPWSRNHKYPIYVYPLNPFQQETLWGLTAQLVYEFVKKLKKK
ncbi:MAG: CoA pyrophosphatase [Epulopiscium sp.]|nr:CoA pyrophosphatase [Candidatus Epulonipiscium sp.]